MRNQLAIATLLGLGGLAHAQAPAEPAPAAPPPAAETPPTAEAAVVQQPATTATKTWTGAIAPRLGLVIPTSDLGAMVLGGLELTYALPALDHRLVVAADLSLTRPSYDGAVMDPRVPGGTAMYTLHETEMVIGVTLGYRLFGADRALVPWGAVGPVLHLLRTTESTNLAPGDNKATSTEAGVEVAAGADYRTGPGFLVGELRVVYSNLDHLLTGDTNAGKVSLAAGYRFVF